MTPNTSMLVRCAIGCLLGLMGCQPAEQIEPGNGTIVGAAPAVAVRNGHAVVTWHRSGIRVSSYDGSGWSAPQLIAPEGTYPDVAVSDSGGAIVVFGSGLGLQARVYATSRWSPLFTLDSISNPTYAVGVEGAGRATVVWSAGGQVRVSHQEGGGWLGTLLSASAAVGRPQIAVNGSGVAFAAWCDAGGTIWGSRRVPPNSWEASSGSTSACCQAPLLDQPGPAISVGVSSSGEAVIVGGTTMRVCEKRYVPGSGWQATTVLNASGPDSTAPQLAVAPDGHALVAWNNYFTGGALIRARAYVPGSGWGAVLTGPAAGHGLLGVGIGSSGSGAIVYRSSTGVSDVIYDAASGILSAPSVVYSQSGAYLLRVGFDPSQPGQGVSTWQQAVSSNEAIWAARLGL